MNLFMLNDGGYLNLDCISYIPPILDTPRTTVYVNYGSGNKELEIETDDALAIVNELGIELKKSNFIKFQGDVSINLSNIDFIEKSDYEGEYEIIMNNGSKKYIDEEEYKTLCNILYTRREASE